jgi:hypothetical protein
MKKLFTIFILMLMVTAVYAQNRSFMDKIRTSAAKDDNFVTSESRGSVQYQNYPAIPSPFAPAGTVPFGVVNYNDYGSNGNNMRKLVVLGDTIIVGQDVNPDMTMPPPPATVTTRIYYQVSYDGGTTWMSTAINTSPATSNRWANLFPIFNSGLRSVVFSGRVYVNNTTAVQGGLAMVETILGLGSLTSYTAPLVWRDYFAYYKNSTSIGGIVSTPSGGATDSLVWRDFNYATGTWGPKVRITDPMAASFRYYSCIADNGLNCYAAYWNSVNLSMFAYESTNGGTTWSAGTEINPTVIGGDGISSWFGGDMVYKPNSTFKAFAWNTLGPGSLGTATGSKVIFYSPTINGGNPVIVMDWKKYFFTADTNLYNANRNFMQIGMTNFSHATLAYSDDGTKLYCAFSAVQIDTSDYGSGATNYSYNNIFICKSTDDGLTWGNAYYVTNTPRRDETYPTLAKKGNTGDFFHIVYNESGSPGSYTFNDNAPPDTTYTVYKKFNFTSLAMVPVGIKNISSEVPASFALMQNYPNPFNPTTTIRFNIPKASPVTIKVYNVTGQLVATLANNEMATVGTKEVTFNATNLSSGIYFYTIQAGSFTDTKKMMLVK